MECTPRCFTHALIFPKVIKQPWLSLPAHTKEDSFIGAANRSVSLGREAYVCTEQSLPERQWFFACWISSRILVYLRYLVFRTLLPILVSTLLNSNRRSYPIFASTAHTLHVLGRRRSSARTVCGVQYVGVYVCLGEQMYTSLSCTILEYSYQLIPYLLIRAMYSTYIYFVD